MSQLQENQLFADRYRLVKKLGSGAFGDVWLADYKGVQVAVKIYNQFYLHKLNPPIIHQDIKPDNGAETLL